MPEVHADGLFGVVPERVLFQAPGAGFLWSRARKGWFSGTSVDSILPWHPKCVQSEDGHRRGAEGFSSILSHLNQK